MLFTLVPFSVSAGLKVLMLLCSCSCCCWLSIDAKLCSGTFRAPEL